MSEPIRVLNVVGRMDRGGIETLIMNVYRHIDRTKVQFDFLAHYGKEDADYNEEIKALGGRIYEMPVIKTTEKTYYWRLFTYIKALKHFFKEHPEYHIVHGHMTNTAAIYMPIAKKYGKVTTCIAHSHLAKTQKTVSPMAAIGTDLLRKPIRFCATDYFSCSEAAAHWLFKDEDIQNGRVRIIDNGIDSKKFAYNTEKRCAMRKKLGIEEKCVIGHVGRFFPPKNHEAILRYFRVFHEIEPNSVLMLVGDGELRTAMEKRAMELGIEQAVMFMGIREDVPDLMLAMDLFIMPSLYEGLPMVGVEAQASGLPLLLADTITREVDITGNVHFLSLENSEKEWADKMLQIVNGFVRKDTREKIVNAKYDIYTTTQFLQNFYIQKHSEDL